MSGISSSGVCPECNSDDLMTYSDWKPFDQVSGECLNCGFTYWTETGQLSEKELAERRKDFEWERKNNEPATNV